MSSCVVCFINKNKLFGGAALSGPSIVTLSLITCYIAFGVCVLTLMIASFSLGEK